MIFPFPVTSSKSNVIGRILVFSVTAASAIYFDFLLLTILTNEAPYQVVRANTFMKMYLNASSTA